MCDLSAVDLTEDRLGRQCIALRDDLRRMFAEAREIAATWTPRPCPPRTLRHAR